MAARLETRVKRKGKWRREVVYLISSLTIEELQAQGMLRIKRGYWAINRPLNLFVQICPTSLCYNHAKPRPRSSRLRHGLSSLHRLDGEQTGRQGGHNSNTAYE